MPSMRLLLALLFFASPVFVSAAETNACAGYNADADARWESRKPGNPGPFRLAHAYLIYRDETDNLKRIRNDKVAHCYIGCRIAQDVDVPTVLYVAWLKEKRDLTDCRAKSHFDEADERATILGADLAPSAPDAASCLPVCRKALGK